jgi:hypothetical protein
MHKKLYRKYRGLIIIPKDFFAKVKESQDWYLSCLDYASFPYSGFELLHVDLFLVHRTGKGHAPVYGSAI